MCPASGELGKAGAAAGPRIKFFQSTLKTAVVGVGEADDLGPKVDEGVAVWLVVDKVEEECATATNRSNYHCMWSRGDECDVVLQSSD